MTRPINMIAEEHLNRKYDNQISQVDDLCWMPWVGKMYDNTRVVIVGESHYEDGDDWQEGNRDVTRIIISKVFDGNPTKLCLNTAKVMYGKKEVSKNEQAKLWGSCIYMNLVQRLLLKRTGDLKQKDRLLGWKVFFDLVDIVKPQYCLVLAKGLSGSLGAFLTKNDIGWSGRTDEFYDKQKTVINLSKVDEKMRLVFINHPTGSRGFDYVQWSDFLNEEASEIKRRLTK